jgi:hypothetical protein
MYSQQPQDGRYLPNHASAPTTGINGGAHGVYSSEVSVFCAVLGIYILSGHTRAGPSKAVVDRAHRRGRTRGKRGMCPLATQDLL